MKALIIAFVVLIVSLFLSSQPMYKTQKLNKYRTFNDATLVRIPLPKNEDFHTIKNVGWHIENLPITSHYFTQPEVIKRGGLFTQNGIQIPQSPSAATLTKRPVIKYRKREEIV